MNNYFFMPSKILFGSDAIINNKQVLNNFGTKAFIVTGKKSALISGALADLISTLDLNKIAYEIYNKVEENPKLSSVLAAKEIFNLSKSDFIIGVGGGSPIDFAKALSVASANNLDDVFDLKSIKKAFKIIAVPTTSGTGTEVTKNSVINDDIFTYRKKGFSHDLIFPSISFIDPKYTLTLNKTITTDTGIDALSHLLEGAYSKNRTCLVYPYIIDGIINIIKYLPLCLKDLSNLEYREKLSYASLYGGIVIAQAGTTLQHSIGYYLTYKYGISHGKANLIFMKAIFNLFYSYIKDEIDFIFNKADLDKFKFFSFLDQFDISIEQKAYEKDYANIIDSVVAASNTYNSPLEVDKNIINKILNEVLV